MFFRLLANSLARRMSRKLLAAFAVWVGITLILAFLAVSIDVGDKMNRELQAFGSNIRLEPVAASVPVRVGGHDVASTAPPVYLEERDLVTLKRTKNNILGGPRCGPGAGRKRESRCWESGSSIKSRWKGESLSQPEPCGSISTGGSKGRGLPTDPRGKRSAPSWGTAWHGSWGFVPETRSA